MLGPYAVEQAGKKYFVVDPDGKRGPSFTVARGAEEFANSLSCGWWAKEVGCSDETILGLRVHPVANEWPMLEGQEFQDLVDDIREHGLRDPITVWRGMIVDGRNRAKAMEILDAEMDTYGEDGPPNSWGEFMGCRLPGGRLAPEVFLDVRDLYLDTLIDNGDGTGADNEAVIAYIRSKNDMRRHLVETPEEKKARAVRIAKHIQTANLGRKKAEKRNSVRVAAIATRLSERTVAAALAEANGKPKPTPKLTGEVKRIVEEAEAKAEARREKKKDTALAQHDRAMDEIERKFPEPEPEAEDAEWTPLMVDPVKHIRAALADFKAMEEQGLLTSLVMQAIEKPLAELCAEVSVTSYLVDAEEEDVEGEERRKYIKSKALLFKPTLKPAA